jgi:4-amino-4-deoxy-L-arabinose transferase-like glycosyltransferase
MYRRILMGMLMAAATLRLLYMLDFRAHSLFWQVMLLDGALYDAWARRIIAGDLLGGSGVFTLPPLYPYLVALVYAAAGASPRIVFVLQAFLGIGNLVLLVTLARRIFGDRAALASGLLALGYGPLMFLESKLLNGTLTVTLTLLLLHLALRAAAAPRLHRWLGVGLVLGLLCLLRPEMLLLGPALIAWAWRAENKSPGEFMGFARTSILPLVAGIAIVLTPVALRNAAMTQTWSPGLLISSQGAITFYQANNARAAGLYVSLAREGFSGDPERQADESIALASRALGRPLDRAAANRYWRNRALSWMAANPGAWLRLEAKKLARFFGSYEYSTEYIFAVERRRVASLWLAPVPFGLIAALGLAGWITLPGGWPWKRRSAAQPPPGSGRHDLPPVDERQRCGALLLSLVVATNLAACLLFYVSSRYRLPAAAALIVLAGGCVDHLIFLLGRPGTGTRDQKTTGSVSPHHESRRTGVWLLTGTLLLAALLHRPLDERHLAQEANLLVNTGSLQFDQRDYSAALQEYTAALALRPDHAMAHLGAGSAHEAMGETAAAEAAYRRALGFNRRLEAAREGLRRLSATD